MPVFVHNLQRSLRLNVHRLLHQAQLLLSCLRLSNYDVSVVCETTDTVQSLNSNYRGINKPTDILSFPMYNQGELAQTKHGALGDIFLAIPFIQEQSELEGSSLEERLPVILSHGLCHLAGHDHTTTELLEKMIKEENKLLCCYNNASGTALTSLTELDEK
eukprot:m.55577 g.55577  ORF g.55577 m.55577 type:complete len:161 (+) comp34491_c0_seq6:244-726(+)